MPNQDGTETAEEKIARLEAENSALKVAASTAAAVPEDDGPVSEMSMDAVRAMMAEQRALFRQEMDAKMEAARLENAKLRREIAATQNASADVFDGPTLRHCNGCGAEVEPGKRCPRHPGEPVHEVALDVMGNVRVFADPNGGIGRRSQFRRN